ncbi:MAG: immunoglobulin domain-containing protein, partial [Saprospiraceae bacterium]
MGFSDSNNDGRIDDGNGNPPVVSFHGLTPIIDPMLTAVAIPLPPDTDVDGVPDWQDLDSDNDGINDVVESVQPDPDNNGIIGMGAPTVDVNGQAIMDTTATPLQPTSTPTNTDETGEADFRDLDADDDGINDVDEADQPDLDADGKVGTGIPVVNAQGQATEDSEGTPLQVISNPEDTDTDSKPDFQDIDRDGDGILDSYECPGGWPCINTDSDALPDVDDLDSDNDLLLDEDECPGGIPCPDTNTNTVDNFLEYTCASINTPMPILPIGGGQFCEGSPVQLSASGDTAFSEMVIFKWTGPNDFAFEEATNANTAFPVELIDTRKEASGTYELTLATTKGCQSEPLKIAVDLMEKPLAPALTVTKDKLCAGEDLELEVNTYSGEAVTYIWYKETDRAAIPVDTTNIATLLVEKTNIINAGIYTAVVNVDGCVSSISNAEIVQVKTPIEGLEATSSATILNPACEGETVQLSVPFQESATYEWTGPNNFSSTLANPAIVNATFVDNGNYSAVVTFDECTIPTNTVAVTVNTKPTTPLLKMETAQQCEGESATLKIIEPVNYPTNETLRFNWYTIGRSTPISTTLSPTLDLINLQTENDG